MNQIRFHSADRPVYLKDRKRLKSFLISQARQKGYEVERVRYVFCSDDMLLSINQQHLQHDTYTDIITFYYNAASEPLSAEIYISVDRVRENANAFVTTFNKELHRVIFHGFLHLLGYTDKSKARQKEMRMKEDELLEQYFTWNIDNQ